VTTVPRNYATNIYSNPFRNPQVRHIRLSYCRAEIVDHYGRVQVFRKQIEGLEAKAKRTRFRKPINTSVFAYHIG
jgi:hypothetical protein